MRTIKELLQVTLTEGNKKFKKGNPNRPVYENGYVGLCGFVEDLQELGIITHQERDILDNFINTHKPFLGENYKYYTYYWKEGKWNPRKKWLIYQINNIEE
jgi:hypothetical protein